MQLSQHLSFSRVSSSSRLCGGVQKHLNAVPVYPELAASLRAGGFLSSSTLILLLFSRLSVTQPVLTACCRLVPGE